MINEVQEIRFFQKIGFLNRISKDDIRNVVLL